MPKKRIVFSRDSLDDEILFVTLYHEEQVEQMALLNMNQFFHKENTTIYHNYKDDLKAITNQSLLYIDFLSDERGIIFHYEKDQQIEYRYTYFSLQDPFFRYLFQQFIYKEQYQEKLKILSKYKKSDTL